MQFNVRITLELVMWWNHSLKYSFCNVFSPIFPSFEDSGYSYEGRNFVLINKVLAQKNILGSTLLKCLNTRAHGNRAYSQQTEG